MSVKKGILILGGLTKCRKRDEFVEKGIEEDVIELRYKHYCKRQIDTINRVLDERRMISKILVHYLLEMRML
jgi:hypothetical protein